MTSEKGGTMPAHPVMSEDRVKRIEIKLDENGKPYVSKENLKVTIDPNKYDEVIWFCDGPFRIDFKGGTPFNDDQFDETHRCSGLVKRSVLPSRDRPYEYTINVKGKTLDPEIFVWP
jgi:hypothetical protein